MSMVMSPAKAGAFLRGPWGSLLGIGVFAVLLLVVAPVLLSDFRLNNMAKYCAWALVAVGIGLAWGRGGMLVMGQGVFFGLGAYAMGMHMQLESVGPGGVPTFMILYDPLAPLPFWWEPFRSGAFTIASDSDRPDHRCVDPGLCDLQATGQGGLLRDPDPGAGGCLGHAHHVHHQVDRRRHRPVELHVVLRLLGCLIRRTSG